MPENQQRTPFQISEEFTDDFCDLEPTSATYIGVRGRDHLWSDLSPDGVAATVDLFRSARDELAGCFDHPDPVEANAARVMSAYLEGDISACERGNWKRNLGHVASPFQSALGVFDLMPRTGAEAWSNIQSRFEKFGDLLDGYRASLEVGMADGDTASRRQVESVIEQVRAVAVEENRFSSFPEEAGKGGGDADTIAGALDVVRAACAGFADWLETSYLPSARSEDAAGEERYLADVDRFLGMEIDPVETYQWGWAEVHRLMGEMRDTARVIDGDKSLAEVMDLLDTDLDRSAPSHQAHAEFVQALQETAVSQLDGTHFDVPDEIKTVTVSIAPPGGPLGAWYVPPSEDFTRPGSIWYALGERERIPHWQEVTTAYHEGFPGHHLQVGYATLMKDRLSRFHRLAIWYAGSGEGWALYAENLMDELGFFSNPEYRLGLLSSQLFRSTRIVVDIGSHLGLSIPDDAPLFAGEEWSFERAVDYMDQIGLQARDVAESEVKRYLGWWGQAIAYKVGEREILNLRQEAKRRRGGQFDRKDFHRRLLEAGAVRLDHLREVVL